MSQVPQSVQDVYAPAQPGQEDTVSEESQVPIHS